MSSAPESDVPIAAEGGGRPSWRGHALLLVLLGATAGAGYCRLAGRGGGDAVPANVNGRVKEPAAKSEPAGALLVLTEAQLQQVKLESHRRRCRTLRQL
jgi:hypothetical protein